MYESGAYVAEHVEPLREAQRQPNGVDLTVAAVFEQTDAGRIGRRGKSVGARRELEPEGAAGDAGADGTADADGAADLDGTAGADGTYHLDAGGYVVRYGETIAVPESHVGFVYPRSSLMRNSCMLNTAVWDAGYEGKGEGLLQVHHPVEIERGARIAQFVLAAADHEGEYAGDYQGENL